MREELVPCIFLKSNFLHVPIAAATGPLMLIAWRRRFPSFVVAITNPQKMFIGDGAKLVRDAFELAKEKCKDQSKVSFRCSLPRRLYCEVDPSG